jgi:hypothetical protein
VLQIKVVKQHGVRMLHEPELSIRKVTMDYGCLGACHALLSLMPAFSCSLPKWLGEYQSCQCVVNGPCTTILKRANICHLHDLYHYLRVSMNFLSFNEHIPPLVKKQSVSFRYHHCKPCVLLQQAMNTPKVLSDFL